MGLDTHQDGAGSQVPRLGLHQSSLESSLEHGSIRLFLQEAVRDKEAGASHTQRARFSPRAHTRRSDHDKKCFKMKNNHNSNQHFFKLPDDANAAPGTPL